MARVALDFASMMRFGDGAALKEFALIHRFAHQEIATGISSVDGVAADSFDVSDSRAHAAWELLMLKPKDAPAQAKDALNAWLLLHAQMHQSEYDALGLGDITDAFEGQSFDLSTVDMTNPDEFNTWMLFHQQIHDAEDDALGITA